MEGWLLNPETKWAYRFHRDEKSWIRDPMVFVDMGMEMPGDEPPLLKTRQRINKEAAKEKWVSLIRSGCKRTDPLWGSGAEP